MVRIVEFEQPSANLVSLVENTDPDQIINVTIQQLRDGAAADDMLTAAGLAVSCSTELPPGHHGGPVHPVSGLFAARALSAWSRGFVGTRQSAGLAELVYRSRGVLPG